MSTLDQLKRSFDRSKPVRTVNDYMERKPAAFRFLQLFPALFWVLFFLGISLTIVLVFSLTVDTYNGNYTLTFEHYREFFTTPIYIEILIDSLRFATEATVANLVFTYPVAYYLAFFVESKRWRNAMLLLMILPFWINIVIRAYAWRNVLSTNGPLNYLLVDVFNVLDTRISLLQTETAVIIGLLHVFIPYMLISIYSTLDGIDRDQIEAAQNLGANKFETFYEITLPQSMPGVVAGSMIVFVLSAGAYVTPILLGGYQNSMISNVIGSMFRGINDWELGSAIAISFVVLILFIIFLINHFAGLEKLYSSEGDAG